ncbi:hypothetical protein D7V77_00505 [Corallococcus sp. CA041A]|nr:hypothetical protein D7V77_00505 [Corallococcus sp. CA041A]
MVIRDFGDRAKGSGTNTTAYGYLKQEDKFFVAKQGGPVNYPILVPGPDPMKLRVIKKPKDARVYCKTYRNMGEWTGYHAEMIIVSGMLGFLSTDARTCEIDQAKRLLTGSIICANASCCMHCGNMLDELGIAYHEPKGAAGLTAWWNPLTDKRVENGTPEFKVPIPGNRPL